MHGALLVVTVIGCGIRRGRICFLKIFQPAGLEFYSFVLDEFLNDSVGPNIQHKDGSAHSTMTELTLSQTAPKPEIASIPPSSGPPNGDWRAWVQVFGSFLIVCSAWSVEMFLAGSVFGL